MALGTALFLIAAGAILRWAVTAHVAGVDIRVVGLILLIVGIVGLAISLWMMLRDARAPRVQREPY